MGQTNVIARLHCAFLHIQTFTAKNANRIHENVAERDATYYATMGLHGHEIMNQPPCR
jgi:hypothetical protein